MNSTPPELKPLAVETVTSTVSGLREVLKHSALIVVLWSRKMPHTQKSMKFYMESSLVL